MLTRLLLVCALSLTAMGCGTEDEASTEPTQEVQASSLGDGTAVGPKGDKGDKGDTGPEGPAGRNGVDGKDGTNGTDGAVGAKGEKGEDGRIVNDTMWFDPIEERYWTLSTHQPFQDTCESELWRLPTGAEVETAKGRGLILAAKQLSASIARVWVSGSPLNGDQPFYDDATSSVGYYSPLNAYASVFCIEK